MKQKFLLYSTVSLCCGLFLFSSEADCSQKQAKQQKVLKKSDEMCALPEPKPSDTTTKQGVHDIRNGFSAIVKKLLPAVVNVSTTQIVDPKTKSNDGSRLPVNPLEEFFKDFMIPGHNNEAPRKVQSLGSGFIIKVTPEYMFIVTNYHVVSEAKKISIFFDDQTEVDADVHASDERTDISVLKVKRTALKPQHQNIIPCQWGTADSSDIGDWVVAIGNPFGLGSTVTAGIISSKGRDIMATRGSKGADYIDDYIQHSAQINMGNSGGCLLDMKGQVIGINTAIFSPSGGNVGIGFAIPAEVAKKTVDQLIDFSRTKRGWLGLSIQHINESIREGLDYKGEGDIVASVTPDSPASKGGIQQRDIIISFDGKIISQKNRLTRLVGEAKVGDTVDVKIQRDGKELILKVTIGEYEEAVKQGKIETSQENGGDDKGAAAILGLRLAPLPPKMVEQGQYGVMIKSIEPLSLAEEARLMPEDIIHEIIHDNKKIKILAPSSFKEEIEKIQKSNKKSVLLLITRGKQQIFISLKMKDPDLETKKK